MLCTVIKASCLTTAKFECVKAVSPMMRETAGKYTIYYFKNPATNFYNPVASRLLGREIHGNAIVLGATADELQNRGTNRWSELAKKFDKIELNETNFAIQEQAERERQEAWEDYQARKARRKADAQEERVLMNNLVIDEGDGVDGVDTE